MAVEFFRVVPGRTELIHRAALAEREVLDAEVSFVDEGAPVDAPWRAYYCRVRQQGLRAPAREARSSGGAEGTGSTGFEGYDGPEERAISSPVWFDAPGG